VKWSALVKQLRNFVIFPLVLSASVVPVLAQDTSRPVSNQEKTSPAGQPPAATKGAEDSNEAYKHSAMVQKLGGMMGMSTDTAAIVFEIFNFAILAVLLGGFLIKTLPKTFRNRTSSIQKELVDARTATEEASTRLTGIEDRLSKLDGQIADMRLQAEKDAISEEQRIRAVAEEEKARILAAADLEISSASLSAQRSLQKYAAELAIDQAARKLIVTAETDRLLVQGFTRRLAGEDSTGGPN
jgi:F-type H+-transporting ATPase subunit b